MERKKVLSIAGSDCSGGAGIQADIKTILSNGGYAMSAITSLTAQNTMGVLSVVDVRPDFLKDELDVIFNDIEPDATKIGMVANENLIDVIYERLSYYSAKNIVLDPVMVSTSGSKLIRDDAIEKLKKKLFNISTIITPNILEAEILSDVVIKDEKDMENAAIGIYEQYGCNVLVKGGHRVNDANDFLYTKDGGVWLFGDRINNPNTHGTGCTLSSAIATNLAKGYEIKEAITIAKEYLSNCLRSYMDIGKGSGPLDHGYFIKGE